jgi:hypothetical protein
MSFNITFEKICFDEDIIELKIITDDGNSRFSNNVYVNHTEVQDLIKDLGIFKNQIYGGLFDINFGRFGPEWGYGAFHARLHFQERGKIYISIRMQSDFFDFGKKSIANEAFLYLISEPALLDNFINELRSLNGEIGNTAIFECIDNIAWRP